MPVVQLLNPALQGSMVACSLVERWVPRDAFQSDSYKDIQPRPPWLQDRSPECELRSPGCEL